MDENYFDDDDHFDHEPDSDREPAPVFGCACENALVADTVCAACIEYLEASTLRGPMSCPVCHDFQQLNRHDLSASFPCPECQAGDYFATVEIGDARWTTPDGRRRDFTNEDRARALRLQATRLHMLANKLDPRITTDVHYTAECERQRAAEQQRVFEAVGLKVAPMEHPMLTDTFIYDLKDALVGRLAVCGCIVEGGKRCGKAATHGTTSSGRFLYFCASCAAEWPQLQPLPS